MTNIDKIKTKVQKLINQANDRQGQPEAEAFMARAVELMAKYGFEERDLDRADAGDEIISQTIEFSGSYTDMQARLLTGIAQALHCDSFGSKRARSTKWNSLTLFGKRRHIERVAILFPLLNAQMASQSKNPSLSGNIFTSTVTQRRSFMLGYIGTITNRLTRMENSAADGTEDSNRYAVALVDDAEAAKAALRDHLNERGMSVGSDRARYRADQGAMRNGSNAANRADLGQARMGGARAAIGQ